MAWRRSRLEGSHSPGRRVAGAAALGAGLLFLLLALQPLPSRLVAGLAEIGLAVIPLGEPIDVELRVRRDLHIDPAAANVAAGGDALDASWDTEVILANPGTGATTSFLLNPRRVFLIPLMVVVMAVALAPLPRKRRLVAGAIASLGLIGYLWTSTALLVASTMATDGALGFATRSASAPALLDLAVRTIANPPGNRFVVPLFLAIVAITWQLRVAHHESDASQPLR